MTNDLRVNLEFFLYDWLHTEDLFRLEHFSDHSRETVDALLRAAEQIAAEKYAPFNRLIDTEEPTFDGESVTLPQETQAAWDAYVDLGLIGASHDHADGGMQLPHAVDSAANAFFGAAAMAMGPASLTASNAALILAHGTPAQRAVFATAEMEGRWAGTMALSEPAVGSSLSDITTRAVPDGTDSAGDPLGPRYRVTGTKMWISGGDHELTDNIVHLVLAKVPREDGSVDPSTRGISLFIVPKHLTDAEGGITGRNDVSLIGLNHKLGFRGLTNTALAFGDGSHLPDGRPGAVGYLVGKEGDGLRNMFFMMNAVRIEVGFGAALLGYAGYAASLAYARDRRQGRPTTLAGKDVTRPPVTIVEHADVRRMLLAQKAYAEGSLALCLWAAHLVDRQHDPAVDGEATALLLDTVIPVVKSWPSEWCLEANSLAIQVLGGAGYTRDHPVEQYWRDNRLNMIHEGTHGIHGLDLLGRKAVQQQGRGMALVRELIGSTTTRAADVPGLKDHGAALTDAWAQVEEATAGAWATGDPAEALANATPYLQGFGHVLLAWVWLELALAATDSSSLLAAGKLAAADYFYAYELPRVPAWLSVARDRVALTRDLDPDVL